MSFPGLPSHPQYELFKRIARAMSGMCCFYIKGNLENAKVFLASLKVLSEIMLYLIIVPNIDNLTTLRQELANLPVYR